MRKLVEFQILDRNALYYGVDLSELMDNAGVGIADYIYKNYKKNAKIVFVCGNGNNGVVGCVASSILLGKGFDITIFQSSTPTSVIAKEKFLALGLTIKNISELEEYIDKADRLVDCLLGSGIKGNPRPPFDKYIEIMNSFVEVVLTSRVECGNTVRKFICSPLYGVCKDELFDATPYALAIAKFLLSNPLNQAMPSKFKYNFTCCEKHGMIRIVDVGLLTQIRQIDGEIQKGFKIFLGGGLGNKSFVDHELEEFTPVDDSLSTSIAVLRIFDRLGDRKNLARNRMRYLVNDMGWETLQTLVLKERAIVHATQSVIVKLRVAD